MALLDMARNKGVYLEVAHMNYHHRDSADRDEKIVRNYCRKNGISFHKSDFKEENYKGNFQDNARKARYEFFNRLCNKFQLDEVLIGHNLDDFIETYLMQKQKNIGVSYYGIKERNEIYNVKVYRPLLNTEKNQLEKYCLKNNIIYGVDESNLSDQYTRNRIRHSKVEKMSLEEKKDLYRQIIDLNKENERRIKEAEKYLKGTVFDVDYFCKTPDLQIFLHHHFPEKSSKTIQEMIRQLKESNNCVFEGKDLLLVKEYGKISKTLPVKEYEYIYDSPKEIEYKNYGVFRLSDKGNSFEGATLSKDDFPLTVRNYRPHDRIEMTYGKKGINRYFIDKKIPYYQRRMWPIVLNRCQNIILAPGIGCDVKHYSKKHNFFVIKLKNTGGHCNAD